MANQTGAGQYLQEGACIDGDSALKIVRTRRGSRVVVRGAGELLVTSIPGKCITVKRAVKAAFDAGLCVVPPKQNGSKRPLGTWKEYSETKIRPSLEQLKNLYGTGDRTGIGIVTGAVSRNLEMLEFESEEVYLAFKEAAKVLGLDHIVTTLENGYLERTPGGGYHWFYYCTEISGNTPLARIPAPTKDNPKRIKPLIETRGEGGYVVVAPSYGKVHPSGKPYELLQGGFKTITTITPEDRRELFNLARTFDRMPVRDTYKPHTTATTNNGDRPGDDFNVRADWRDILLPAGWTWVSHSGGIDQWRRPGKNKGVSATTNHHNSGMLYVFSTSTEFEPGRNISKFAAYAILYYQGNFKAAAQELKKQGYGNSEIAMKKDFSSTATSSDAARETVVAKDKKVTSIWRRYLDYDEDGKILKTIKNVCTVLENDEQLKGKLARNGFTREIDVLGPLPWRKDKGHWTDNDDANLRKYLEVNFKLTNRNNIADGLEIVTGATTHHPIRDYLDTLKWDGLKRIDTLLIDYLAATDNEYVRTVTRKTLVAAVARVYVPGTKFDSMLLPVGPQGIGKSTFFRLIAGDDWYTEDLRMEHMKSKAGSEILQGKWVVEVGELAGLRKTEVEEVKSFLSRTVDRYREPYGRRASDRLRQCVIVGTTNALGGFLRDQTGNRRFWPVAVGKNARLSPFDINGELRDQIWAEAKYLYKKGEQLCLSQRLEREATIVQEEYTEENPWFGMVENYLYSRAVNMVCGAQIWIHALGGDKDRYNRREQNEIATLMAKIPGWERVDKRVRIPEYGLQRVYRRLD